MENKIPIILCIDVEPDGFFINPNKKLPWKGYENLVAYFSQIRSKLEKATQSDAHFSWFYKLDAQVEKTYGSADWPLIHYASYLDLLEKCGDEFGLHPHAYRWIEKDNDWVEDRADQSWVNYCTELCFKTYEKVFRRKCKSFRFGANWINNETLNLVENLGGEIDLTLEPGFDGSKYFGKQKKKYIGSLTDFNNIPRYPYRKSKMDFAQPGTKGNGGIWMIPLTSGMIHYRFGRLEKAFNALFAPDLVEPFYQTLKFMINPRHFKEIAEAALKTSPRPYLAIVLRSDAGQNPRQMNQVKENMKYLLNHPLKDKFIFTTPTEALEFFKNDNETVCSNAPTIKNETIGLD